MQTVTVPFMNIGALEGVIGHTILGWRKSTNGSLEVDFDVESLTEEEKERIRQLLGSGFPHGGSHVSGMDEIPGVTGIPSNPPSGKHKIVNMYWDAELGTAGQVVVEKESEPEP